MVPGYFGYKFQLPRLSMDTLDTGILFQVPCVDDCPCVDYPWMVPGYFAYRNTFPGAMCGLLSMDYPRMVPGYFGYRSTTYVSTRWLSLEIAVQRSLKQLPSLTSYFKSESESQARFKRLQKIFNDPMTKVYLLLNLCYRASHIATSSCRGRNL